MISPTAEYALRAVVALAYGGQEPMLTVQIAEITHVPAGYLSKVLQILCRAGLLQSQRGINGGYRLARAPDNINVLDVVNAVDPLKRISCCPLGASGHDKNLCPLHRRLDDTIALVEKAFSETKISELLQKSSASSPLCYDK